MIWQNLFHLSNICIEIILTLNPYCKHSENHKSVYNFNDSFLTAKFILYKARGHSRQRVTCGVYLCIKKWEITVNRSLEQGKAVVIWKTSFWEPVSQGSGSRKKAGELISCRSDTNGMWVVHYNESRMACYCCGANRKCGLSEHFPWK